MRQRVVSLFLSVALLIVLVGAAKPAAKSKRSSTTHSSTTRSTTTQASTRATTLAVHLTHNLVEQSAMEGPLENGLPLGWQSQNMGAPGSVVPDRAVTHSGKQAIRISANEITRIYAAGRWFPVAPGEKIHAGAWVKVKDIPEDKGAVIVIAEFAPESEDGEDVAKVDTAKIKGKESQGWQHITGVVTVPPMGTRMRLRIGMSYSKGTVWVDDVTAQAEAPLVIRCDSTRSRIVPTENSVPVTILNREGRLGRVQVKVQLKDIKSVLELDLLGSPTQHLELPFKNWPRGNEKMLVSITPFGTKDPIFTEERPVTVPFALTLSPPIPTHWAIEDGAAHINGDIDLEVAERERDRATLRVRLVDSKKKELASWNGAPDPGWQHFQLDPGTLPEGAYTMIGEFIPRRGYGKPVTAERAFTVIPRRLARVTIDAAGYPVYDGKAIFPIGIFNGGKFEEQGKAGFTISHAYNAVRIAPNQMPDDNRALDFLELSQKNGMKCVFMVPLRLAYRGQWDIFRRRIAMFKNHPALLAWDEEESIARGECPPEVVAKMVQIVKEEDPNHPFMIGDSRDVIYRLTDRSNFFPLDLMDMGMWWWYPFPLEARKESALNGEQASKEKELIGPEFLLKRNTTKPIWVGIQSYKKDKKSRFPTSQEYRAQAYAGIIFGAQGLMYYGGYVHGGMFALEKNGEPDEKGTPNDKEAHWDYVQGLVRELNTLSPVFMAPTVAPPRISPPDALVSTCIKQLGARQVMFAVNRSEKPLDVTFEVPNVSTAQIPELFEKRQLTAQGGIFKDHFGPLAVHVYELKPALK